MIKAFHVSDVLTAATGKLYSLRGMEGVYDIMGHLSGENLMPHTLVRAFQSFTPVMAERFPELASIKAPDVTNTKQLEEFIAQVVADHGEFIELAPMTDLWESLDPLHELVAMRAGK